MPERSPMDPALWLARLPLFHDIDHRRLLASLKAAGCDASNEVILSSAWVIRATDQFHCRAVGTGKTLCAVAGWARKLIELVGPGASFAEALMFSRSPMRRPCPVSGRLRTAFSTAQSRAGRVQADSGFALRMLAGLSRRLHGLVSDVQAYALQNGVQR